MTRFASAFALGLTVLALSCSPTETAQPQETDLRRKLLASLGENVWLPTYSDFADGMASFETAAEALCSEPNEETFAAARDAWWSTRAYYEKNELLSFGPLVDEPTRAGPQLDFWPARPDTIEEVLASDTPLDAAALETLGSAARGMPVIEYLLWVEGTDASSFVPGERRCEYLLAAAADSAGVAAELHDAWDPEGGDYLSQLTNAGRSGSEFESIEAALSEVTSRLTFIVENARGEKLGVPLGNRTGGTPQPASAPSPYSGRSIEDVRDNLRGVEAAMFGVEDDLDFEEYLEDLDHGDLPPKIRAALDASYAALDAIPAPLTEAVLSEPASVQAAIDELAVLQRLLQVDLINALGVTLTFNDADGD